MLFCIWKSFLHDMMVFLYPFEISNFIYFSLIYDNFFFFTVKSSFFWKIFSKVLYRPFNYYFIFIYSSLWYSTMDFSHLFSNTKMANILWFFLNHLNLVLTVWIYYFFLYFFVSKFSILTLIVLPLSVSPPPSPPPKLQGYYKEVNRTESLLCTVKV